MQEHEGLTPVAKQGARARLFPPNTSMKATPLLQQKGRFLQTTPLFLLRYLHSTTHHTLIPTITIFPLHGFSMLIQSHSFNLQHTVKTSFSKTMKDMQRRVHLYL